MLFSDNKNKALTLITQGISVKTCAEFIKESSAAVISGVKNSQNEFNSDSMQYSFRSAKSVWMISNIKKLFSLKLMEDLYLGRKVKHLKSYGSDYYLVEGKALICFKRMNLKSRVSGFNSIRFKAAMNGNLEKYSISMLKNLAEMGIHKALPIYYIGYILDRVNNLVDVRIVHYQNNEIAYVESLLNRNDDNLFGLSAKPIDLPPVTPKNLTSVKKKIK